jgi:hypothetical protein
VFELKCVFILAVDFLTISVRLLCSACVDIGHINVPRLSLLHSFLYRERRKYAALQEGKDNGMKLEHIVALTSLGFSMTANHPPVKKMKDRILEYVDFVKTNGRFPDRQSKDQHESTLGSATVKWRAKRKLHTEGVAKSRKIGNTLIPQELVDALDSVGFRWEVKDFNQSGKKRTQIPWETKFELLKAYKAKHGHCEPPRRHPKVGLFAFHMRRDYKFMVENKKSSMTVERFRKLSEIGFRFKTSETGLSRKRYIDNDSSGYDTSSGDDEGDHAEEGKGEGKEHAPRDNSGLAHMPHPHHDETDNGAVDNDQEGGWIPEEQHGANAARMPNPSSYEIQPDLQWAGEKSPRFSQGFNDFY